MSRRTSKRLLHALAITILALTVPALMSCQDASAPDVELAMEPCPECPPPSTGCRPDDPFACQYPGPGYYCPIECACCYRG